MRVLSWLSLILACAAPLLALFDGVLATFALFVAWVLASLSLLSTQIALRIPLLAIGISLAILFFGMHYAMLLGWQVPTGATVKAFFAFAAGPLLLLLVCGFIRRLRRV